MGDDDSPSATLLDAAAASTAARGVCFANAHPAPRRWLPLKAPSAFAVRPAWGAACAVPDGCPRLLLSLHPARRPSLPLPSPRPAAARHHAPPPHRPHITLLLLPLLR